MAAESSDLAARKLAAATARRSYSKLLAYLAAHTGNVTAAEDALAEAFATALTSWPEQGCPQNPEAWLLTVARRRAIDVVRKQQRGVAVSRELELLADLDAGLVDDEEVEIPDRRLGLLFACAHPAVDPAMRAPLMLQVILGLNAATIASAFLVAPATMGQRLVRTKNKLRQAGVPFQVPERKELPARLEAVLDAIYAAYAEGWTDPVGADAARRDLAEEALFLGGMVCELMPGEPEALGLLSLMLHTEARRKARRSRSGAFVPLAQQDIGQWDERMIEHAESLLRKASAQAQPGRYQLEAALQSAHAHRHRSGTNNWLAVRQLYDSLLELTGSPVVAVNRVLAVAELDGPETALQLLDEMGANQQLVEYQPYWAMRAELLSRLGKNELAGRAYEVAIGLERDAEVRSFLQQRLAALQAG